MSIYDLIATALSMCPRLYHLLSKQWAIAYWHLIDWLNQFITDTNLDQVIRATINISQFLACYIEGCKALRKFGRGGAQIEVCGRKHHPTHSAPIELLLRQKTDRDQGYKIVQGSSMESCTKGLDLASLSWLPETAHPTNELLNSPRVTHYIDIFAPAYTQTKLKINPLRSILVGRGIGRQSQAYPAAFGSNRSKHVAYTNQSLF